MDVFSPPSAAFAAAAEQDARIAKLEDGLKKTLERLEKAQSEGISPDGMKLKSPSGATLPPAPLKGGSAYVKSIDLANLTNEAADEERILGVMNGVEIFVLGGMVRQRPVKNASFPPAFMGGKQ